MAVASIEPRLGSRAPAGWRTAQAAFLLLAAPGAALVGPRAALSQGIDMPVLEATTTADLNLRLGPGQEFEVTEVMPEGITVSVYGCLRPVTWCNVSADGTKGWASANYLTYRVSGTSFRLSRSPNQDGIPLAEYPPSPSPGVVVAATAPVPPAAPAATPVGISISAASAPATTPAASVVRGAGPEEGGYGVLSPRIEPPAGYGGLWSALGGAYQRE